MAVLEWLVINTMLPLLPIVFFYFGTLIITGTITWVPPIRDGQICFYATMIAIIAIKDIVAAKPTEAGWLYGLVVCWFISFFVYAFSVYSTIYPSRRLRVGNRRIGGSGGSDERATPQVSAAIR
jgi:hypothetical protein